MHRNKTQRRRKHFDFSKIKRLTDDECGLDSPEHRQFVKEQEALAEYYEQQLAAADLSHLGSKVEFSYKDSKKLHKLTRQAIALKKLVEAYINNYKTNPHSEKLLVSLQHVIRYVNVYHQACRDLPFDWIKRSFLPENKRGFKLSYPDVESADTLMATKPKVIYVQSDDDECESVNESETVEGPFEDPDISRLGRLNLGIPSPLVHLCLQRRHGICHRPDKDEQNIWLEFKKFDEGTREAEVINPEFVNEEMRSLEADHPIVSVVGNFAVAAFNYACCREGEHKDLHDFEFMECKYSKGHQFYYFYMIIEAIQKGNSGTYMAEVACDRFDGPSILCKFVLTDYTPCGTKAMALSYLSCLGSICATMDDLFKEKLGRLHELSRSLKDPARRTALSESFRLKHLQAKVCEGLRSKLVPHTEFHFPQDRNQMTDTDVWTGDDCCSGMVLRAKGSGYDYYNPILTGSVDIFALEAKVASQWKVLLWE